MKTNCYENELNKIKISKRFISRSNCLGFSAWMWSFSFQINGFEIRYGFQIP